MRVSVGNGAHAQVNRVNVDPQGRASLHGWLHVCGVPVVSLSLLPTSWWKGPGAGNAIIQDIWQSLAAKAPEGPTAQPPQGLVLTGEVRADGLDLRLEGTWNHGSAKVTQFLRLKPSGEVDPGPGSLQFDGSLTQLSLFVDTQLLPLVGEHPVTHPRAASQPTPVHADATWTPHSTGLTLGLRIANPQWHLLADVAQDGNTTRFNLSFEGSPYSFSAAARHLQLPRLCQVDDLAGWVRVGSGLAKAWSLSPRAWRDAQAQGRVAGQYHPDRGIRATGELRFQHGPWVDILTGHLGPSDTLHTAASTDPAPEAGLEATVRALAHFAWFASGQHGRWDGDTLRGCGADWVDSDANVTMRRYTSTADFVFPDVLRSVLSAWKFASTSHAHVEKSGR